MSPLPYKRIEHFTGRGEYSLPCPHCKTEEPCDCLLLFELPSQAMMFRLYQDIGGLFDIMKDLNMLGGFVCSSLNEPKLISARCLKCKNVFIDRLIEIENASSGTYDLQRIYPPNAPTDIPQPNDDMPEDIKQLYNEAASIFNLSPRSSSILLRLCVQRLLKICGYKGKTINGMLEDAKKAGVDIDLLTMMNACREIGNFSAHEATNLPQDKLEKTKILFRALNIIVSHHQTWEKNKKETSKLLASVQSPTT